MFTRRPFLSPSSSASCVGSLLSFRRRFAWKAPEAFDRFVQRLAQGWINLFASFDDDDEARMGGAKENEARMKVKGSVADFKARKIKKTTVLVNSARGSPKVFMEASRVSC
jgi:hypothetical protein